MNVIFTADSVDSEVKLIARQMEDKNFLNRLGEFKKSVKKILSENQPIVKRLLTYKESGYRKLESIKSDTTIDGSILLFIEETPEGIKKNNRNGD